MKSIVNWLAPLRNACPFTNAGKIQQGWANSALSQHQAQQLAAAGLFRVTFQFWQAVRNEGKSLL